MQGTVCNAQPGSYTAKRVTPFYNLMDGISFEFFSVFWSRFTYDSSFQLICHILTT